MAAYTTIDDPSAYFKVQLYTGNGSANHAITFDDTDTDMQPDFVWIKNRDAADAHCLFDSVRGATQLLSSDANTSEATDADTLDSFASDGFQVDADDKVNTNTEKYVAWCWKAGTAHSNDQSATGVGDIDSEGSANTTAGFSIAKFTTSGTSVQTVAHGLGAVPDMYIAKGRANNTSWFVYHKDMGNTHRISLDTGAAAVDNTMWGDTSPTSTVFSINPDNFGATTSIGYFFKSIQGYSKIGLYTGNGNADGPFIYTGFQPSFIMLKTSSGTNGWWMGDSARSSYNNELSSLYPEDPEAEYTSSGHEVDWLSNGFKIRNTNGRFNTSGGTYIYIAFAKAPLVNSNGVPCTAR